MKAANVKLNLVCGLIVAAAGAGVAAAQCGDAPKATAAHGTSGGILEVAASAGSFKTLLAAIDAAGLKGALQGDGPYTVFAPTDEAFAALPAGTLDNLLRPENKELLQGILKYHVVSGRLAAADVSGRSGAATLNGQRLQFAAKDGAVRVDKARVVKADVGARNGVIHVIDAVVLPSTKNIVETAQGAAKFNTLLTAATKAGLADTLANGGPLTVFAPTDEAFAKLPAGTLENLLKPENRDQLANILKYHVVSGRVYSTDALAAGKAKTLLGQEIVVASAGGQAKVNGARLLQTDLDASNGVIHVIDEVILPQ
ncbi:MAG: fasciclin domain-containing protein [Planctomycetota bacterium]